MPGHWICDRCGYDGEHADYCVYLRPIWERSKGHRTKEEMKALRERAVAMADDGHCNLCDNPECDGRHPG